jgi:putative cardiolipin synthase
LFSILEKVFVGSLNLAPKSITEPTENGIMVESTETAEILANTFEKLIKKVVFRLELRKDDEGYEHIYWHGLKNGTKKTWPSDPHTGFWQRCGVFFMSLLPIESQL